MPLTSPGAVAFALAVLALARACPPRRLWLLLLVASYGFYATWGPAWLPGVLAFVTLAAWRLGLLIGRAPEERRGGLLWLGLGLCLAPLLLLRGAGALGLDLPSVGVSYYCLQAVAYLLDVRQEVCAAEGHLGRFALHLAFFPKLVQGPIERAPRLLPQLLALSRPKLGDFQAGAQLFLWGIFQKVVVADRLAPFVDAAWSPERPPLGLAVLVGAYFFAAQVYFDFAGYTDMALGLGRLFGVRLTQNFDSPYLSASIAEFWRRWHVSLSTWLLDYLFRPLQLGLRDWRTWGTPVALVATFLVSGAWHGTGTGFLAWGLLHGLYLGGSVLTARGRRSLLRSLGLAGSPWLRPLQVALTFHLVCLSWVFFRAPSAGAALQALQRLVSGLPASLAQGLETWLYLGQGRAPFLAAVAAVAAGSALRAWLRRAGEPGGEGAAGPLARAWWSPWLRTALSAWMLYAVLFAGAAAQSFLYERF